MFAFRPLFALALVAGVVANPLESRQTSNTNSAINSIVDALDVKIHAIVPTIDTMQANGTANDATIGAQINQLVTAFNTTTSGLKSTAVSSGSNTTSPTNDDISITFSDVMQLVATGLSGLSTSTVPSFSSMISELDPAVASAATALNTTLPGSLGFVHIMMLDAQQFLVKEGGWPQTLAALGF
ncbi:POXA3b laccase small subunit [Crucibulum laeve]|uniref:POXA3b laccase small subunit n=1 Tax=Crucibulum laeve TaxID=68775 RepID=A0A5C3M6Y4_9AGAR|nr:POXA3b laccase small subunit [Crucibulum laeve]